MWYNVVNFKWKDIMYIESYIIWAMAIWIIYLLYRTHKWAKAFNDLEHIYTQLKANKGTECAQLWRQIELINKKTLPKAPIAKRSKILREEAQAIIAIAENSTYVDEYLPGTSNGATTPVEGSPYARIDFFFGSDTFHLKDREDKEKSLYDQLNEHIYEK